MKIDDVSIASEYETVRTAENETLLSFNDDAQSEAFQYWWYTTGVCAFVKHYNNLGVEND